MPAQGKKQSTKPKKPSTVAPKVGNQVKGPQKAANPVIAKVQAKPPEDAGPKEVKVQVEQVIKEGCENEDIIEEFICRICLVNVVGCGPKMTVCSHLFCGDCMEQWFASHQTNQTWAQRAQSAGGGRTAPCPVCKQQLHEGDSLFPVSPSGTTDAQMLWHLLSTVKVTCSNHSKVRTDGKCTWTGTYGSYNRHVHKCENEPIEDCVATSAESSPTLGPRVPTPDPTSWDDEVDTHSGSKAVVSPCDGNDTSSTASEPVVTCATESTADTSEADSPVKRGDVEPADTWEDMAPGEPQDLPVPEPVVSAPAATPVTPAAAPSSGKPDPMSDLLGSIRELVALSLQQAPVEPLTEVLLPPAEEVEEVHKVKVAHAFAAENGTQLSLLAGDFVEILETHDSGWTYGRKCSLGQLGGNTMPEGWFPQWAV